MEIYEVPAGRRYWVIRANKSSYFDHFIKYGIVAVGHLDEVGVQFDDQRNFIKSKDTLRAIISGGNSSSGAEKAKESRLVNQLNSFINDISVGDWILTVNSNAIRFGVVRSAPYIENEPLSILYDSETGRSVDMDFSLRREVGWGPEIARKDAPYGLSLSLNSQLTVFNVDRHWEAIYHTLAANSECNT